MPDLKVMAQALASLQWGRARESAEWATLAANSVEGNLLQWGRARESAEWALTTATDYSQNSLQWGRARESAEC